MNTIAPPPMADVNALVELAKLLSDKKGATAYLDGLQATSAKIYADLKELSEKADAIAAKETAVNEKEVDLNNREAAIVQRELSLRDQENAHQAKVEALRSIVG